MNDEYGFLKTLSAYKGYQILEALWLHQVAEIEKSRDSAAKRGTESAWRYHAGREAGFKLAMTALQRALLEMESTDEKQDGEKAYEDLMAELGIKEKPQ